MRIINSLTGMFFTIRPKDIIFYNADIHGNLIVSQRMAVIKRMLEGEPVTVITTIDGLFDRLLPLEEIAKKSSDF